MTADLRRRAEQAIAAGSVAPMLHPQAILALLDERDRWQQGNGTLMRQLEESQRRVAALEGQIDAIREAWEQRHVKPEWMDGVARALLAAAPSEPHAHHMVWRCDVCGGDPAALPAEVEE